MKLLLDRIQKDSDVTIGSLTVDEEWEAWTLEDAVREIPGQPVSTWKIPAKTAIPFGVYEIDLTMSNRFKRALPLLLDVPGFSGIRIHPGNTADDTEGCILVGHDRYSKSLGHSRMAFEQLFRKMSEAKRKGEKITIGVV